jgi:hypothetical protein
MAIAAIGFASFIGQLHNALMQTTDTAVFFFAKLDLNSRSIFICNPFFQCSLFLSLWSEWLAF